MDLSIDEFQRLADDKSLQAMRSADLERQPFVSHLSGLDRFAFLKTFLEFVLPAEHYQEQLLLVNEVMVIPEEPKQPKGDTHNHYVTMTGSSASYTENNNAPDSTNQDN